MKELSCRAMRTLPIVGNKMLIVDLAIDRRE